MFIRVLRLEKNKCHRPFANLPRASSHRTTELRNGLPILGESNYRDFVGPGTLLVRLKWFQLNPCGTTNSAS